MNSRLEGFLSVCSQNVKFSGLIFVDSSHCVCFTLGILPHVGVLRSWSGVLNNAKFISCLLVINGFYLKTVCKSQFSFFCLLILSSSQTPLLVVVYHDVVR
jgi:hypothetical protein